MIDWKGYTKDETADQVRETFKRKYGFTPVVKDAGAIWLVGKKPEDESEETEGGES